MYVIFIFHREASSPCQRDTILLNLSRNLPMILQGLQSPTLFIQELLQKVTEKNAVLTPKRHPAPVEFKVRIWICVCMCMELQVFV